ncbi:flagellar protein FliS [Bremerella cremea]|uniref:Flagellar protein FliS n=1 Tax=Bremerella cremea TaxID=1031537 RepID=A0A368KSM7_9BACT|nr:flagellar export chaperone FliS [Bremerella cremea]RCS47724.1 flagellar protein FliS [Bremerella cremea]
MTFSTDSPNSYLETEVLTATPQKLQLMMINGAIRYAYQAQQLHDQGEKEAAWEKLLRCREIVALILSNISPDGGQLMKDVAGIYTFIFRELTQLHAEDEYHRLDGVIKVLDEERQTWEELCLQMPEAPERPSQQEREITSSDAEEIMGKFDASSEESSARSSTSYGYDNGGDYYGNNSGGISFDA